MVIPPDSRFFVSIPIGDDGLPDGGAGAETAASPFLTSGDSLCEQPNVKKEVKTPTITKRIIFIFVVLCFKQNQTLPHAYSS